MQHRCISMLIVGWNCGSLAGDLPVMLSALEFNPQHGQKIIVIRVIKNSLKGLEMAQQLKTFVALGE